MARDFSTVGVIGLGTMGAGIVEVFARNGFDVVAVDVDDAAVERGRTHLQHSTDRAVSRGKLTPEDQAALIGRATFTSDLGDLKDCQLVVEAVPEHLDLKKEIFARLDAIVSDDAILATNTSSLPVTEIAVATINPKRVVGMHFFNPAPVLQFVEVIKTVITSDETFEDVKALAERLGKKPVVVGDKAVPYSEAYKPQMDAIATELFHLRADRVENGGGRARRRESHRKGQLSVEVTTAQRGVVAVGQAVAGLGQSMANRA